MHTSHAFRLTFALVVMIGVFDWVMPFEISKGVFFFGTWIGYFLLGAFGYMAVREGRPYRHVFAFTWAFVAFWFVLGLLNFAFGRGSTPVNWSHQREHLAFYGFLFASAMFLPVAFAFSGLGVGVAKFRSRNRAKEI